MIAAQPICKGCGQPMRGRYLTALGATWHPEHFICTACGHPITDSNFNLHQGLPYHSACYNQHVAPRCAYCDKPLSGEYLIDHWGTQFCKAHQHHYPTCIYCGRLVPPHQQEPSPDTPECVRCPLCRASAIETAEEAKPLFTHLKQWISNQGLVYNNLPLSLELCGRARLAALLQERNQTHARGATVSTTYTQNGHILRTEVSGVAVLRGLPAIVFQGVTIHELGHVWLIVHDVRDLPLWAEEGFCELLAHRLYTGINTPESNYHATCIENNTDPVYGKGFRRVRAIADVIGFSHFLETLRTTKRLPG